MRKEVGRLMQEIGLYFELDRPVGELGPSKQQMTEILRVMLLKPEIIIFDEPTSSLTKSETQLLFALLKRWQKPFSACEGCRPGRWFLKDRGSCPNRPGL